MEEFADIKSKITQIASDLGFDLIKFAKYDKLSKEIEYFKSFLAKNYNVDMLWMESNVEKREDPQLIFPEIKSVIVMASSYNFGISHIETDGFGKISRYAWGRDYHKILDKRNKKFRTELETLGIKSKFYTDTGPCLDKQWAVRSGLGWQGKNGLVINRSLGSYFFISVGFLNIEIPADKPYRDYCGECTKCIDACPTNAIIENKVVDANKCLSYWTIENRDEKLPKHISENLNNWIFGCDICQQVCPWNNHRNLISKELDFLPRNNEVSIKLEDLVNMEEEEFSIRFMSSPVKRTKLSGMKRNSLEVLNKIS